MSEELTRLRRPWPTAYARLLVARLLMRSYFFLPYLVLYAEQIHVPLGTLLVIEAVFAALIVLGDLPAGLLADRIGPRQALAAGIALEGGAALLLAVWPHVLVFWLVQPLFAAATVLSQGSDAGLAGALLRRAGRDAEFEDGERRFQAGALAWNTVVFVAASGLSVISLRATFLGTAVALLSTVGLVLTVPDVRADAVEDDRAAGEAAAGGEVSADPGEERAGVRGQLAELGRAVRETPGLPWDLGVMVLTGTAFAILLYLMPVYIVHAGVPERLTGVVSAGVALLAAGAVTWAPRRLGAPAAVVTAALAAAALAAPSLGLVVAGVVLVQCAQGLLLPAYRAVVLRDLRHRGDAAAMSVVTTASNAGFAVLAPFLGALVAWLAPAGLALVCAGLFGAAWAVGALRERLRRDDEGARQAVATALGQATAAERELVADGEGVAWTSGR
jgi:MFS family permease